MKRCRHGNLANADETNAARDTIWRYGCRNYMRFLEDERVPYANNMAENDARMAKLLQKIFGCFRTEQGAEEFLIMRNH